MALRYARYAHFTDPTPLGSDEAKVFEDLRAKNAPREAIKRRMWELYYSGFSIMDIWRAYVTKTSRKTFITYATVRNWMLEGESLPAFSPDYPLPAYIEPPIARVPRGLKVEISRIWPVIPLDDRAKFAYLAKRTRTIRGSTAPDAPARKLRERFHDAIRDYYERGVQISHMAEVAGVTHRAIAHRIDEMGLRKP